jgi:Flp pilus assembly protein CpaB
MRRRRPRTSRVLMLLSFLLASSATLTLRGHLARLEARAAVGGPAVPVVVAAARLSRGTALAPEMLRVVELPRGHLPPGPVRSIDEVAGRTLAADIAAGEPITEIRVTSGGGPVAALVPRGLRAVPVSVSLPAGAVAPGDRVDVLATFVSATPHTETVAPEVEVLRVLNQRPYDESGSTTTVFVLVTPDTAERLAFSAVHAELSVAVAPPS